MFLVLNVLIKVDKVIRVMAANCVVHAKSPFFFGLLQKLHVADYTYYFFFCRCRGCSSSLIALPSDQFLICKRRFDGKRATKDKSAGTNREAQNQLTFSSRDFNVSGTNICSKSGSSGALPFFLDKPLPAMTSPMRSHSDINVIGSLGM